MHPQRHRGSSIRHAPEGITAYLDYINDTQGGVCGRKIVSKVEDNFDDRAKALDAARKLVEQDKIFAMAALNKYIDRDPEGRIIGVRNIPLRDALLMMKLGSQIERAAAGAEPLGAIDSDFVLAVADAFTTAFQEVNSIEDQEQRAAAFQERCLAAVSRLLAGGDGNGG